MGAVPHICNGADIMAPGIVKVEREFQARAMAVVVDEKLFVVTGFSLCSIFY
jgi:predicted RNA-binding protein (TIGR00451 family)